MGVKFVTDLYIIHGWTYTIEPWAKTLEILQTNGINVKMLRVPGLTSPSDKVWTIDDYVHWADQNIPDGAIALGHSNGGRILLNLCATKPNKLKFLILLDSAGIYEPSAKKTFIEKLAKLGKPLKKIPLINKAFHRLTGSTDYSNAPANMKQTLTNMLESDKSLDLSRISTKTLILWGKNDTITPPRHAEQLHARIGKSELKFYANWPHSPYLTDPEGLARVLTNLIRKLKNA